MQLKSVSNRRSPLESVEAPRGPERAVIGGSPGTAGDAKSRAAVQFLVSGSSKDPLAPRRRSPLESLMDPDNDRRKQILETELAPWRMICALEIEAQDGTPFVGTGWFIGPRTVVTAGHCVHDAAELGGWAGRITVIPGRNGASQPFGSVESRRFSAVDRWLSDRDPEYDYGAIHLDADLGTTVGTFAAGVFPDATLRNRLVNISGYPAPRGGGTEQYFHSNRVKGVTPKRVFYDVDTQGGQSGSPVWTYEDGSTTPVVIGIHAYGLSDVPGSPNLQANAGTRLLPEVLDVIRGWMGS